MVLQQALWSDPKHWLAREQPDEPVFFFDPAALRQSARAFVDGFPGEVTFAVKANPDPVVLETLIGAGIEAFDVASPEEMTLVRDLSRHARLHYHNPVRSQAEIDEGKRLNCTSWSVDRHTELDKLGAVDGMEIAVRFKLPVKGAVYDFGSKFGAEPAQAVELLKNAQARGARCSLTFHPGTQCEDAQAWVSYIDAAAQIAQDAGVALYRLNVGGGFPAHRQGDAPQLNSIFQAIKQTTARVFDTPPPLVCEPGRALVAEAFALGLRIKARTESAVFLNDGIYGGLSEWRDLGPSERITACAPDGCPRVGQTTDLTVFGPTCDSLDRLSDKVALPSDIQDEDYLIFAACGAYSNALATRFNGYGVRKVVTLLR